MRRYLYTIGLAALWISPIASANPQSLTRIPSHYREVRKTPHFQ